MATPAPTEEPTTSAGASTSTSEEVDSSPPAAEVSSSMQAGSSSKEHDEEHDQRGPKEEEEDEQKEEEKDEDEPKDEDEHTELRPAKRLKKTLSRNEDDADADDEPSKKEQVVQLLRSLQGDDSTVILEALSKLFVLLRDEMPGDGITMALYHACGHSDILKVTTRQNGTNTSTSSKTKLIVEAFFVLHSLTCWGRAQRVGFPHTTCHLLRSSLQYMGAMDAALSALEQFSGEEDVAFWSLSFLLDLLDCFKWTELFDQKIMQATIQTMNAHSTTAKIQRVGCKIIKRAAFLATADNTSSLGDGSHGQPSGQKSGRYWGASVMTKIMPRFAAGISKHNSAETNASSPPKETGHPKESTTSTGIRSKFLQAGTMSVLAQVMENFDDQEQDHFTGVMATDALQTILSLPK